MSGTSSASPSDPQLAAQIARWRLILGKGSQESLTRLGTRIGCPAGILEGEQIEMDEALEAVYPSDDEEISRDEWDGSPEGPMHGYVKGRTFPRVAKWLDQIRDFFPKDVVVLLQQDAIERHGMKQLLLEPEIMAKVEPSIDLAAAILSLKNLVPEKAKASARDLVRRVVEEVRKRLEDKFAQAIRGASHLV